MPRSSSFAASFNARFTSSVVVSFSTIHHHVNERNIWRRNANRDAVKLSFQLRQHQRDCFCRTGRSRNHRQRRSTRASQILVRQIEKLLIVRVRVNRRHLRRTNAELFMNHLRHRRETVGRAGSVRNDVMCGGIVLLFVNAEHDRDVFILWRRRDDHFLDACRADVSLRLRPW